MNHLTFFAHNKHKQTQPRVSFILRSELDKGAKSLGHDLMSSARTDHYSVGKLSDVQVRERGCLKRGKEKKYHQSRSQKYQLHSCLLYFNYKQANLSESFQTWYMLCIQENYLRRCMCLRKKTPSADSKIPKRQCSTLVILLGCVLSRRGLMGMTQLYAPLHPQTDLEN